MSRLFNVDVDCLVNNYELSYQNANIDFMENYKKLCDNVLKAHNQNIEEHSSILKQLSDLKDKINTKCTKLQNIVEKVECEQHTLQTETNRLESLNNECKLLKEEENNLIISIEETKVKETQVFQEKKENIKKFKREINAFKTGISLYEQFLQLNMNIVNKEANTKINLTMKNFNNHVNYNIILEECDKNFHLKDVIPHNQSVMQAATLYNQNKDIQGLLAFLYKSND